MKINWTIVFCILTSILSISSFFISEGTLKFDKINFIIAVLAVLVTILVCFQVYNAIQLKSEFKDFEERIKVKELENNQKIKKEVDEYNANLEEQTQEKFSFLALNFYFELCFDKDVNSYLLLRNYLNLLYFGNNVRNEGVDKIKSEITKDLFRFISENREKIVNYSDAKKTGLLNIIKLNENIIGFSELKKILEQPSTEGDPDPQPSNKNQQANNNFGCTITQNQ